MINDIIKINNENDIKNQFNNIFDLYNKKNINEIKMKIKIEKDDINKKIYFLDNRLNKLKNEEEKNWKKIQNKKKQKNEKLIYLKNVVDNIKQIENAKLKKEKQIE